MLSPEQKAKQRGSLSINEGYFSDIFNVQQSSYSSFTTKSIICEDLPDHAKIERVNRRRRHPRPRYQKQHQRRTTRTGSYDCAHIPPALRPLLLRRRRPSPVATLQRSLPDSNPALKRCLCAPPPTTSPTPSSVLRFYPASRSSVWAARTPVTRS